MKCLFFPWHVINAKKLCLSTVIVLGEEYKLWNSYYVLPSIFLLLPVLWDQMSTALRFQFIQSVFFPHRVSSRTSYQVLFYVYLSQNLILLFPPTNPWCIPPSPKPILPLTIMMSLPALHSFTYLMYVVYLHSTGWLLLS